MRTLLYDFRVDEAKSRRNLRERGFGFDHAATIFVGPTLEKQDTRHDYGEIRIQAIGHAGGDILFVLYTDRDDLRHIISARRQQKERRLWQSFVESWSRSAE